MDIFMYIFAILFFIVCFFIAKHKEIIEAFKDSKRKKIEDISMTIKAESPDDPNIKSMQAAGYTFLFIKDGEAYFEKK